MPAAVTVRARPRGGRRYLLQLCALEIFFSGGGGFSSVFFSFESAEARHDAQRALLAQTLPALSASGRKADVLRPDASGYTRAWQLGA
eukprot:4331785-Prymnesium_polylepis.1